MQIGNDYTDITVILDRSGSMKSIKAATIEGLNEFIETQKALPGTARFRLVAFASDGTGKMVIDSIRDGMLDSIDRLNEDEYQPNGGTPLLDAIGKTLVDLAQSQASGGDLAPGKANALGRRILLEDDPQEVKFSTPRTIVLISTDGEENTSRLYTRSQINAMIQRSKEKLGWEFLFAGANQDAIKEGGSLGVGAAASVNFNADQAGSSVMYAALSAKSMAYRTSGIRGMMSFDAEDQEILRGANSVNADSLKKRLMKKSIELAEEAKKKS